MAARLGGPVGAAAVLALVAGLAFDGGGFAPVSYDRALVGAGAAALLCVLVAGGERPGRLATALLAALGVLTAWTAASWAWSDSPPLALEEAQRVALYFAAAVAVTLVGRRLPVAWVLAAVTAGATAAACWNLFLRLAPDWAGRAPLLSDVGQLADPVGYANSLALLAALGVAGALGLGGAAAILLVPLAADVALQQSNGTVTALVLGLAAFLLLSRRPAGSAALLALPLAGALVLAQAGSVVAPPPTGLLAAAHTGHHLLLLLVLLVAAQAALVRASALLPAVRVPARFARPLAAAIAVGALAAAPFASVRYEREHYWSVAWHELAANPLLGSGAGTFVDWWLRLRTVPLSTHEAHSLYLETLAELGPLGLVLLLGALAAGLAGAWRLRAEPLGPALVAALVTFDVAVAVDFHWELAGATVPAMVLAAAAAVHAEPSRGFVRNASAVPALAVLTGAGVLALAGNVALDRGDAQQALRFAPFSSEAWKALGAARGEQGDTTGAAAAYRHAVDLDPNDWSAWLALARLERGEPRRLAEAEAARLNPLGGSP